MMTLNMRKLIIFLNVLWIVNLPGIARDPYKGEVRVDFIDNTQSRETVTLQAELDLNGLQLGSNEIITFTPALRSLDGDEEMVFEPVSVSGKRRAKSIRRKDYYAHRESAAEKFLIVTKRSPAGYIPIDIDIPFRKWMVRSQMVIVEQTEGCCNDRRIYRDGNDFRLHEGGPLIFPEPYQPVYTVTYREAPKGEIKLLQETYSAQLNFQVNKTDLIRDLGNNARILAEVDEMVKRVKTDPFLTIRKIIVHGYASPEGNAASNQRLSEGRAQAFVNYLHEQHDFHRADHIITAQGLGEDWDGLRKIVEDTDSGDREQIIDIINNTPDINRRKNAIRALSGGKTYNRLLAEVYPLLRRNEYTIEYEVRGFNVEEATEIFPTRPQLLSLEELFMIANQYEHDSDEYKQVFDVAARIYPDSPIAQFNAGVMEIENGSYNTAIRRLERFDTPDTLNNLGVAYWHKGEYDTAKDYFVRAVEAGSPQAKHNLDEFEKWLETWDE